MSVGRSISDASDLNDTRSLAVLAVPAGSLVLYVSRNDFDIDRMLKARGCRVVSRGLGPVGTADADTFDAVLMLDVLGYVDHAAAALAHARRALKPGGRLIASFANVAHGAVRLSLVHGTFPYSDGGLLDRARVRFFDHHTAEALLLDGGFRIDERLRVTRGLDETEIKTRVAISSDLVASIRSDPEATTYELVFVASQAGNLAATTVAESLAERLQRRVRDLAAENCALSERARRLGAEVDAREASARDAEARASQLQQSVVTLEAELSRRMEELRVRHHELRQLQTDVVDREAFIAQFRTKAAMDRAALEALETQLRDARAEVNRYSAIVALPVDNTRENRLQAQLAAPAIELARTREKLEALRAYASSKGFRLVDSIAVRLKRFPSAYNAVRALVWSAVK
jgi:2-polyprenyl-3-methyl-5-hydroxy-6-metoxy-1,4-benzoquinol methylase